MSKHILVVELMDDKKCHGCPLYQYLCNGGIGMLFHEVGQCGAKKLPDVVNHVRPDYCPLISTDELIAGVDEALDALEKELGTGETE